jgi:serine/threonine protein kinase
VPLAWDSQKLPIALGIAHGLSFLHKQNPPILHRDLKPDNILVDESRTWGKICDFDSMRAQSMPEQTMMTREVGTPLFSAPEIQQLVLLGCSVAEDRDSYTTAVDVWSLGCVLACIHHNTPTPFPGDIDATNAVTRIASGALRPHVPAKKKLHAVVDLSCRIKPNERPTAEEVVSHLEHAGRT